MIKKLTNREIDNRFFKCMVLVMLGVFLLSLGISSLTGDGPEIFIFGLYGIIPLVIGILRLIELSGQSCYPERCVYCKRCRRIIKKEHKFCSNCRSSIKRSIQFIEDKKYFKDYKKFYGGKKCKKN